VGSASIATAVPLPSRGSPTPVSATRVSRACRLRSRLAPGVCFGSESCESVDLPHGHDGSGATGVDGVAERPKELQWRRSIGVRGDRCRSSGANGTNSRAPCERIVDASGGAVATVLAARLRRMPLLLWARADDRSDARDQQVPVASG